MKVRFKYSRHGAVKFIGHLDMMRYFQKAMRRAHIAIKYSEGYSPHQIMSFATPIGVGMTSDGEYFDIEAEAMDSSAETLARLNATMAEGVEVTGCVLLPDDAKNAMSMVAAADYRLSYREGHPSPLTRTQWAELVQREFTEAEQFTITKKTKKSERELDLKPLVYALEVQGSEEAPEFFMRLSAGSTDNIKPELLMQALYVRTGLAYDPVAFQIHRVEVYARDEAGALVPLLDFGTEIL